MANKNINIQERYVNFYTDFAFKKLFGTETNKELLISFLNALLKGKEDIKDITYLTTEHLSDSAHDRRAVFDVYCENVNGDKFLIEMQKANQEYFKDRSVYYSTFPIREQARRGEWNYELKRVYAIGILNFTFDNKEEYMTTAQICDVQTKEVFYDKLTFIYLEMPKFRLEESQLETLFDKWMFAIKNLDKLYDKPQALQEKVFHRLFEQAEIAHFTPTERQDYEESLKIYRDWYSVMLTQKHEGFNEGIKKGRAEGEKVGIEKGRAEGRAEGEYQKAVEMAKNMKKDKISVDVIAKYTGLSADEIEKL